MNAHARQRRLPALSPRAIDVGLAVAVGLALTLAIAVADEPEATRSPDLLAYVVGLLVPALLLARRQHPLLVLVGSAGALLVYYGLGYPAFSPALPLAVAAYSAAVAGHVMAAGALLAGIVIFGAGWQTLGDDESLLSVLGSNTLADAALLAAVLLLGETVRNRRAWAHEVSLRLERAERDRERDAARRIEQERLRIARELHDVIAHTIAAINVQAGVAADALDDAPGEARTPLRTIREQSRTAVAELKAIVGLLRGEGAADAPRAPAPGLDRLDGLLQTVDAAGVQVDFSVRGPVRALPGSVELTAYRIVQESLTNVLRHAHASAATLTLHYDSDALDIQVDDDGNRRTNGAHATTTPGHGLAGMRERAAAVGGTVDAGPRPDGGYRVHARLPIPTP